LFLDAPNPYYPDSAQSGSASRPLPKTFVICYGALNA
jgi:hypothetical protein